MRNPPFALMGRFHPAHRWILHWQPSDCHSEYFKFHKEKSSPTKIATLLSFVVYLKHNWSHSPLFHACIRSKRISSMRFSLSVVSSLHHPSWILLHLLQECPNSLLECKIPWWAQILAYWLVSLFYIFLLRKFLITPFFSPLTLLLLNLFPSGLQPCHSSTSRHYSCRVRVRRRILICSVQNPQEFVISIRRHHTSHHSSPPAVMGCRSLIRRRTSTTSSEQELPKEEGTVDRSSLLSIIVFHSGSHSLFRCPIARIGEAIRIATISKYSGEDRIGQCIAIERDSGMFQFSVRIDALK